MWPASNKNLLSEKAQTRTIRSNILLDQHNNVSLGASLDLTNHIVLSYHCVHSGKKSKNGVWGSGLGLENRAVRVTGSGLPFGVWCEFVSTWQNHYITTISLVTCDVQPGPTLALLIQEQHRHDISSCLLLICLGISDYLSINTKQPVTSLQLEGGFRSWMQLCS